MIKLKNKKLIIDIIYDIIGSIFFGSGIHCFIEMSNIAPGGISGIAIMINYLYKLPIGTMSLVLNIPILILGFKYLGRDLILKTIRTLSITTIILDFVIVRLFPQYYGDRLLGSVFGGLFMGIGLGIVFLRGSTTGGTDILSYITQLKFPHISIGKAILGIDCIILIVSIIVFKDIESGLYGMISLFCCTKVIDSILYGVDRGKKVTIISEKSLEIADKIMIDLERGTTILTGIGAYTKKENYVLICVFRRQEYSQLKSIIYNIDPHAFLIVTDVGEVLGEGFKPIHPTKKH